MSTPSNQSPIEAWIKARWKGGANATCEACGHSDWGIAGQLAIKVMVSQDTVFPHEGQLSVVPVVCNYCGNTRFLSTMPIQHAGGGL